MSDKSTQADRDDILTAAMDNVLATRLGFAHHMAGEMSAGDKIDRGLGLCRALREQGFGVVKLSADSLFIGQHPRHRLTTEAAQKAEIAELVALLREANGSLRKACAHLRDHGFDKPKYLSDVGKYTEIEKTGDRIDAALAKHGGGNDVN